MSSPSSHQTSSWTTITLIFLTFFIILSLFFRSFWIQKKSKQPQKSLPMKRCIDWIRLEGALNSPRFVCLAHEGERTSHKRRIFRFWQAWKLVQAHCKLPKPLTLPHHGERLHLHCQQGHRVGSYEILQIKPNDRILLGIPIDLNKVKVKELTLLPRVSHRLAKRIIQLRQQKGYFRSLEELLEVKGIGQKRLKQLKGYLFVGKIPQMKRTNTP